MVIWLDPNPCTNCGAMEEGHTRRNCPEIECFHCHEYGHISDECPSIECNYCHETGHIKAKCPKLERKSRGHRLCMDFPTSEHLPRRMKASTHSHPSMELPRRVEVSQIGIDSQPSRPLQTTREGAVNSWELVPSVVFPNLNNTICHLTSRLVTDPDVFLQRLPYHSVITHLGGPRKVAEMLLEWIDPYIRTLEGKLICTKQLLCIQERQNNLWSPNGGYLDIVTDSRNEEYWRAYPGQSKGPAERLRIHNRAILRRSTNTLHYYVIAQGQGYRAANWLKLWEIPKDTQLPCTSRAVALNILEMTMCRAFQTLPGSLLEAFYGPSDDGKPYSNLGLNIIPPVLQGLSLGPSVRKCFSLDLEDSPDPDISGWPQFRYEYGKKAEKCKLHFQKPLMQSSDLLMQLQHAIQHFQTDDSFSGNKLVPHQILTDLELSDQLKKDLAPIGLPWVQPNGNPEALVGFVLDDFLDSGPEDLKTRKILIPSQLTDSGWNMENSLTWAANPVQIELTKTTPYFQPKQKSEVDSLARFNRSILQHSGLRVILLCGSAAQDFVLPAERGETRLKLESGEFPMFLEITGGAIERIYVTMPNPLDASLLREWRKTHRISEMLHFAAAITKTPGIRPYSGDNRCVLTKIIRDYTDERKGVQDPLTLESLHPMIRLWLARRGFAKDEDISLLQQKTGGSLTHAIFVLLHVAPRRIQKVRSTSSMSSFLRSEERHAPEFRIDKAQLESVQNLCDQLCENPLVDPGPGEELIEDVKSREDKSEEEVGEAEVLEREDLELSEVCIDGNGTFLLDLETPITSWEQKKPRASLGDRSFTIGDKTREELLRGRRYHGKLRGGMLIITVHSSIEIFLRVQKAPTEATVKVDIRPCGQRHPHVWAQETLGTDAGSRLAFLVSFMENAVEKSVFVASSRTRDVYKANSFVHWMEGEDTAEIIKRPRQFVVVSPLTKTLPLGIPKTGSFYTDDHINLIPAQEFEPGKWRTLG